MPDIISAEQHSELTEEQRKQYYTDLRAAQLAALAVYEKLLGQSPTTKEKLDWLRWYGPGDAVILRQLALKECQ